MNTEMTITLRDARQRMQDAADALERHGEGFTAGRLRQSAADMEIILTGDFPCCAFAEGAGALMQARQGIDDTLRQVTLVRDVLAGLFDGSTANQHAALRSLYGQAGQAEEPNAPEGWDYGVGEEPLPPEALKERLRAEQHAMNGHVSAG